MTIQVVEGRRIMYVKSGETFKRMPNIYSALANGAVEEAILLDCKGVPEFSLKYLQPI